MNDVEIVARFSRGPWWGFNGVDDLELYGRIFTWRRYRLFRGRVPGAYPVGSVELVSQTVRPDTKSGQPKWIRLTLRIDGSTRTFTGHVADGQRFADALAAAAFRDDGENES